VECLKAAKAAAVDSTQLESRTIQLKVQAPAFPAFHKPMTAVQELKTEGFVRLHFLDTLRGVAAFYIVLFHLLYVPPTDMAIPLWLQPFVATGGTAVTLFFVISAFALCYSADKRSNEGEARTSDFYLRRFFRIAPLFYCMLVFNLALRYATEENFGVADILINATFVFNVLPDHIEGIVPASWTIGVEMIFYLVFPFLYSRARNIRRSASLFLLSVFAAWLWNLFLNNYAVSEGYAAAEQLANVQTFSFLNHFPSFTLGILAYHVFMFLHGAVSGARRNLLGLVLLALFVLLHWGVMMGGIVAAGWSIVLWKPLVYSTLLIGLGLLPLTAIVNKTTVALGKTSYSLYLLHPLLLYFMAPVYAQIYAAVPSIGTAFLLCFLLTVMLLSSMSWISYRLVEKRGIRIGEDFIARRRKAGLSAISEGVA
jgi:peptidoglycan/LPS O-acetylase OafA/YrhL